MTAIIILGGHRCGTSAVAGVCHALGVFMGYKLIGKNRDNKKGHFEDLEFVHLNKMVVGDWRRPMADFEPHRRAYKKLIDRREKHYKHWGFKDPRLCFILPHILPLFKTRPKIIHIKRSVGASARSMFKRGEHRNAKAPIKVKLSQAVKISRAYRDAAEIALKIYDGPVLRVEYDILINKRKRQVELIADFVGLPMTAAAQGFIDPALRHQKGK